MRQMDIPVLTAADLATDEASAAIESDYMLQVSAQAIVTGSSPVGTIQFEVSNDVDSTGLLSNFIPTDWSPIGSAVSVNATGVWLIPAIDVCYAFIRVKWTAGSGTGTISVNLKSNGA